MSVALLTIAVPSTGAFAATEGIKQSGSAGETPPNPFDRALYWHDALAFGAYLPKGGHLTTRQTTALVLMRVGLFPCVVWEGGDKPIEMGGSGDWVRVGTDRKMGGHA